MKLSLILLAGLLFLGGCCSMCNKDYEMMKLRVQACEATLNAMP